MKKLNRALFITLLSTISTSALAIPNTWTSGAEQGWIEYSISDDKNQILRISCNDSYNDESEHTIVLESNGNSIDGLSFLINGMAYYPLHMSTFTRNGGNDWYSFTETISKAAQFDVYKDDRKLASFSPTAGSIRNEAISIATCKGMGDR